MIHPGLEGRVVLITGADNPCGILAGGAEAHSWEADLADPAAVPSLFDRAEQALGPVEVPVNTSTGYSP